MKSGYIIFTGLMVCLAATAARGAVYPWAEYHLGEAGSLSGIEMNPQDSSGANRHFLGGAYSSNPATVSNAIPPAAIGSTACLDTTVAGDQIWTGGGMSFSTLPTNNFAFGIFAKAPGLGDRRVVFSLGDNDNAFGIVLSDTGWRVLEFRGDGRAGLAGNFTPDTWAHLAVIRNAGVTRFYVNGEDQGTPFTMVPTHGSPLLSKNWTMDYYGAFHGQLDEARVVTFSENETAAKILTALQAGGGAGTTAFVNVGSNVSFPNADLAPGETSVFRIVNGQLKDSAQVVDADGLSVAGTAPAKHMIQITSEGLTAIGRYPLIDYTGTIGGQGFAGLELAPLPGGLTGTLEDNVANSTVDLVISTTPGITWTGSSSNVWDVGATANWVLDGTSTGAQFSNSGQVTFNDSAAATVNAVAIAETVSPAIISVNASEDYTFSGAGIGGSAALFKDGTGTLTLTNANTNSGTVTIDGGILSVGDGGSSGSLGSGAIVVNGSGKLLVNQSGDVPFLHSVSGTGGIGKLGAGRLILGSPGSTNTISGSLKIAAGEVAVGRANLFNASSTVSVAAGASLDLAGFVPNAGVGINGSGVNGQGALKDSSGIPNNAAVSSLSLGSDASIGGGWGMTNPIVYAPYPDFPDPYRPQVGGNFKLTKVGSGTAYFHKTDITVKDIVIEGGRVELDVATAINNTYPGTITINGGSLDFGASGFASYGAFPPPSCAKPIVLSGGEISVSGGPLQNVPIAVPIELNGPGGTLRAERFRPLEPWNGNSPVLPPASLFVSGVVSGSGSLVMKGYGTVALSQAPAYTGDTEVIGEYGDVPSYRGKLRLAVSGLADASTVRIANGAVLELGFSGTDTVSKLFIGGVQQQAGVYNSSHGSGRFAGTGSLTVTSGPAGTPYQLFEDSHGIAGAGANADSDGDGIRNAIEFVIGGDPSGPGSDSSALLPVITQDGTNVVCVFRRTDASAANYAAVVQISNSLAGGWMTASHGFNGLTIVEENDGFGAGVDKVTVSFPTAGQPARFVRLGVEIP